MTSPVDQASLRAEMETLATVYVTIQAFAVDSLISSDDPSDHWYAVYSLCISATEHIRTALQALRNASEVIRRIT